MTCERQTTSRQPKLQRLCTRSRIFISAVIMVVIMLVSKGYYNTTSGRANTRKWDIQDITRSLTRVNAIEQEIGDNRNSNHLKASQQEMSPRGVNRHVIQINEDDAGDKRRANGINTSQKMTGDSIAPNTRSEVVGNTKPAQNVNTNWESAGNYVAPIVVNTSQKDVGDNITRKDVNTNSNDVADNILHSDVNMNQGTSGTDKTRVLVNTHERRAGDNKTFNDVNTSQEAVRYMALYPQPVGRLGNGMFQISTVLALSRLYNHTPVVPPEIADTVREAIDMETIQVMNISDIANSRSCETGYSIGKFDESINNLSPQYNWTLQGYFQSWRYFFNQRDFVKQNMKLREDKVSTVKRFLQTVITGDGRQQNHLVIGVHVRRGDFIELLHVGFSVSPADYIIRAMQTYHWKYSHECLTFVFVSDDMKWCQENFKGPQFVFSPFSDSPGTDMALLSLCNHSIVTSGTFGWMGAWLCNGDVIYYRGFPAAGSNLHNHYDLDDYYPPNWLGMY